MCGVWLVRVTCVSALVRVGNEIFVGGGPLRSESAGFPVLSYDVRMVNGHELVPLKRYLGNSVSVTPWPSHAGVVKVSSMAGVLQEWVETATFNGLGHLVTGSNDGSINVFDVESGNCISKRWNNGNNSHAVSRLGTSYPTHDTPHTTRCEVDAEQVQGGQAAHLREAQPQRSHGRFGRCRLSKHLPLPVRRWSCSC